jgi:hypothetical protein
VIYYLALGIVEDGKNVTVKDLLKVLYEKACQQKLWGLVRHTAGMLGKRVEDLAKAVTDLLVRQKQVSYLIDYTVQCVSRTASSYPAVQEIPSFYRT